MVQTVNDALIRLDLILRESLVEFSDNSTCRDNALAMKKYLKNKYDFYGIKSPDRKYFVNHVFGAFKDELKYSKSDLKEVVRSKEFFKLINKWWTNKEREWQYCAMDILIKVKKHLDESHLKHIEKLILQKSWWDTVDLLATHLIGGILKNLPIKKRLEKGKEYRDHNNMWINRTALLYQLKYKEDLDFDFLASVIFKHIATGEFFLDKAIGWVLREHSKLSSGTKLKVKGFIEEHREKLSSLSIREGSKYL